MDDLRDLFGEPTQIEFNDCKNEDRVKRPTELRPLW